MMCEFQESNCNGFGDMWWTDKCTYFSSIDKGTRQKCIDILRGYNRSFMQKWTAQVGGLRLESIYCNNIFIQVHSIVHRFIKKKQ